MMQWTGQSTVSRMLRDQRLDLLLLFLNFLIQGGSNSVGVRSRGFWRAEAGEANMWQQEQGLSTPPGWPLCVCAGANL